MRRLRTLSHAIWHCHIAWTPKYRYRILSGPVAEEVARCIRAFSEQLKCAICQAEYLMDPKWDDLGLASSYSRAG